MAELHLICPRHLFAGGCSVSNCPLQHSSTFCDICTLTYPTIYYSIHVNGKRHKKLAASNSAVLVRCSVCGVKLSGEKTWIDHINSAEHKAHARASGKSAQVYPTDASQSNALFCLLCKCTVPVSGWNGHCGSPRHRRTQANSVYMSLFEQSERDRRGVVVSHPEGLDFGVLGLGGSQKDLEISIAVQTRNLSISQVATFSGSSKKPTPYVPPVQTLSYAFG